MDGEAWNTFVAQSAYALPFHRHEWLEVLGATQGSNLKRYTLATDRSPSDVVGVMPVFIRRFGPFRVGGSPLVVEDTPYLGPVVPDELIPDALIAVRNGMKRDASFLRVLLPDNVTPEARKTLEAAGFVITTKTTQRVDLTVGASGVWEGMEGRCRTAIRRAQKSGVVIHHYTEANENELMAYYRLAQGVYGEQGRGTPNPVEFYRELWRRILPLGLVSLVVASVEGKAIAGAILAHDDRRVYYLDGASDRAYRNLNASNLVLWSALEWGGATGRQEFDFVGSDIPRLARFKASFGGRLVEHSCIEWARSTLVWKARAWWARSGRSLAGKLQVWRASAESPT